MAKTPPNGTHNEYLEVKIEDRRCWVARDDFRILYGLACNVTATAPKTFKELPEDSFIVKVMIYRKWSTGGRPKKNNPQPQIPSHPRA